MIEEIRSGILSVEGVAEDVIDEEYGEEKSENEVNYLNILYLMAEYDIFQLDSMLLKIVIETVDSCLYTCSRLSE